MAKDRLQGKIAVILHADVAGSTALVQQDEQLAHERIQNAFHRFSTTITKYHGRVRELRIDAPFGRVRACPGCGDSCPGQTMNGIIAAVTRCETEAGTLRAGQFSRKIFWSSPVEVINHWLSISLQGC